MQYTFVVLILLTAVAISAGLAVWAWQRGARRGAQPFAILLVLIAAWALVHALEIVEPSSSTTILLFNARYTLLPLLPVMWLITTLQYAGRYRWLAPRRLALLFLMPLITVVLLWTNSLHGALFDSVFLEAVGPLFVVGKTYGPWFWLHTAYSYLILLASIYVLLRMLSDSPRFRGQTLALLLGMPLPTLWSALYIAGYDPIPGVDLTPAVTALVAVFFALVFFRFRLFDVVPIARDKVVEGMSDGMIVLDASNRILDLNPAAQRIFGCSLAQVAGHNGEEAFRAWPALADLCRASAAGEAELVLGAGQSLRYYELHLAPLADQYGQPMGRVIGLHDVTDLVQSREALRETNARLTLWVEELEQRNRQITLINEMGELLQGCPGPQEVYEVVARAARDLFADESGALFLFDDSDGIRSVATWGESPPDECPFQPEQCYVLQRRQALVVDEPSEDGFCGHAPGSSVSPFLCVPVMAHNTPLGVIYLQLSGKRGDKQEAGRETASEAKKRVAIGVAEHVGLALANVNLRHALLEQAIRDPLTGLFNRRYMEETLKREITRAVRNQSTLGIIMLDLDHFKHFNDTSGHAAGDALLTALGAYLRSCVRGEDIACRFGGEEFTLILPGASLEVTQQRAEEIRQAARELWVEHRGQRLGAVTVSLGVAAFPVHGRTDEAVVHAADTALYAAKAAGRDRVEVAAVEPAVS